MAQKHAAAIFVNKNNVISVGVNKIFKNGHGVENIISEHAESAVIKSLSGRKQERVLWTSKGKT